jgi:F-type H+-transporting ATPase subunit delta
MSNKNLVAKISLPYAEALLEVSQKSSILEKVSEDAAMINEVLSTSDNLNTFFRNPLITQESKKKVLRELFSGQVSELVLTFLLVLVDRKRIAYLSLILAKYLELVYSLESLIIAHVITSKQFSNEQEENLIEKLKSMTGNNQVKLEISVDPKLIGGFIIKIGSKVIDISLLGQLKEIGSFLEVEAI